MLPVEVYRPWGDKMVPFFIQYVQSSLSQHESYVPIREFVFFSSHLLHLRF